MNVLIDSSVWIEFFINGPKANAASAALKGAKKERFKTPAIVLFEVYKKIKKEKSEQAANEAIAYIVDSTEIIPLNERIAIFAAEESLETGLAMADAIIVATAKTKNAEIKTMDSHFKGLKKVEII